MPATVTTKEPIATGVDQAGLDREIKLRLKAGAIRCWVDDAPTGRVLMTEWNVIGEQ
jgi:hypothetical protein